MAELDFNDKGNPIDYQNDWFMRTVDPQGFSAWYNANEAQKQRDYETEMSNTAWQRQAEDMRAAGLNPYYAAGPASTPSGTAASVSGGSNLSVITSAFNMFAKAVDLGGSIANTALQFKNSNKPASPVVKFYSYKPEPGWHH